MKLLRILARVALAIFVVWGLIALFHTWAREPNQRPFFFWLVLPYPVLIGLTAFIVATCARNARSQGTGFSWFAVGLAAAASIGLAIAVSTGLFSIISWAYFGHVALGSAGPTDPHYVAIIIAISAASYIWAGAISAALCPQRPLPHAPTTPTRRHVSCGAVCGRCDIERLKSEIAAWSEKSADDVLSYSQLRRSPNTNTTSEELSTAMSSLTATSRRHPDSKR